MEYVAVQENESSKIEVVQSHITFRVMLLETSFRPSTR